MSKETLATLRIAVPGTMILVSVVLLVTPLLLTLYDLTLNTVVSSLGTLGAIISLVVSVVVIRVVVPVLGSLYRISGLRKRCLSKSQARIDDNIKDELLVPYQSDQIIAESSNWLRQDRRLLNVFYDFIDNKESLKQRAKDVYLNGLLWSSAADLTVISLISAIIYFIARLLTGNAFYLVICGVFLVVSLMSRLLISLLTRRHIELGNEQISFIRDLHGPELHSKLKALAESQRQ